jgi:hypothetical protein
VEGLYVLSRLLIRPNLKLPGKIGQALSQTLTLYYNMPFPHIDKRHPLKSLAKTIENYV